MICFRLMSFTLNFRAGTAITISINQNTTIKYFVSFDFSYNLKNSSTIETPVFMLLDKLC